MKHASRFLEEDGVTSSVIFIVENREVYASREVLALCSPVFRKMFESDFRERLADAIPLPGKFLRDFLEFLLCMYPDTQHPISDDNVFPVLALADEYQVPILTRKCEEYLKSKCNDPATPPNELVNILLCAELYNIKDLYNSSFDRVSKSHPCDTSPIPEFLNLHEDTRAKCSRLRSQALDVKLTDGTVQEVLRVAAEYNDRELIDKCELHMIARCKKPDKPLIHGIITMLSAADKHKLSRLKEEVVELAIKRKSHDLEASPIFKTLEPDTRCKVLSKRLRLFEGLFAKLSKLRCHCCRKHAEYSCKICFVSVTKECYESAGLCFG